MEGKNIFEVNGIKYSSNIPPQIKIGLNQEEYAEYLQLKNDSIPKQVIRNKIEEIENSGIWVTEDCFFDGETDNLICQQEFKKYEMEEYIINLLRKLLGDE